MLSSVWVASTKREAAIARRQGWKPCQGRAWTLAPRDSGPEAGVYCWEEHWASLCSSVVKLAEQWREIERRLPEGWSEARLELTVAAADQADEAAALLGPLMPVWRGNRIRFYAVRKGEGPSPTAVGRALARLDEEGVAGKLELLAAGETVAGPATSRPTLAAAWEAAIAELPPDWSDVYAEIELTSTDHLERAALLLAPVNPARYNDRPVFRFRAARRFGYGASPSMVRRCLERLDAEGIRGEVRILHSLSDTQPVATQGPVWYVGGKVV
jgi:hypothetical protein